MAWDWLPESGTEFGKWAAAALTATALAWRLRTNASKDSADIKENNTRGGWITQVVADRDEAVRRERELSALRIKDAELISAQAVKIALLTERVQRFQQEHKRMRRLTLEVRPDLTDLLSTDFGELIDKEAI